MKIGTILVLGLASALLVFFASLSAGDKKSLSGDEDVQVENRQLTFGKTGPHTTVYMLDRHGSILMVNEEGEDHLITRLPLSAASQIFERSELLKRDRATKESAELPYFLQLRDEQGTYIVRWDDAQAAESPEIMALYDLLLKLANRGNS